MRIPYNSILSAKARLDKRNFGGFPGIALGKSQFGRGGGFAGIRIYRIGGIFRLSFRQTRAFPEKTRAGRILKII